MEQDSQHLSTGEWGSEGRMEALEKTFLSKKPYQTELWGLFRGFQHYVLGGLGWGREQRWRTPKAGHATRSMVLHIAAHLIVILAYSLWLPFTSES